MPKTTEEGSTARPVPTVSLDADVVGHNMAARLCASFLSHVLFLKNQVPFPIVQLARMPTSGTTSRAAKKRQALLTSFDALASHLYTTFVALSTALALRGVPEGEVNEEATRRHGVARTFVVVALGPSVGTARSRVVVGIDGLETRVWGVREDEDEDEDEDEEHESTDEEGDGDSDEEDTRDPCASDDDAQPPSRSPSPSSTSTTSSSPRSNPPAPHAEDPETVRAAERLLSRTLASACAEDDGRGLASEMAPTQTHVLLRAPRRFDHPAWVPRQNLGPSLDALLVDFEVESGLRSGSGDAKQRKRGRGGVQGVWITSRERAALSEEDEHELAEEDEWVWWSWDGKLAGFADW